MELWRNEERATPAVAVSNALILMRRALTMLDETDCPGEIGAHLDLAAVRLEEWMLGGACPMPVEEPYNAASGTYA